MRDVCRKVFSGRQLKALPVCRKNKSSNALIVGWCRKTALRIDLWTQTMMVDEMADFYYQVFFTMADTFERATQQKELSDDIKKFSKQFQNKFRELQMSK